MNDSRRNSWRFVFACRVVALHVFCVLGCIDSASGQDAPWLWGVWANGSLAMPSSDVRELPGAPSCLADSARLDDRSGYVIGFGGEIARVIATDVALGMRLGMSLASTSFAAQERIGAATDASGRQSDVVVEYHSEVDITSLTVEPLLRWHPTRPLVLSAGIQLSVPLSTTLDHRELLVQPSQATYGDGTTERGIVSGSLSEHAKAWLGIALSAGIDIAIAKRVTLRPELGGVFALSSPLRDVDWNPHELRAGIAVNFGGVGESTPIVPYER